jgi:synaptojanin
VAGNKGAIAIRLDYGTTSVCFVTAHLAAGHTNAEQRNMDYYTIDCGLHFPRHRSISDHDLVFWAGDSNYRISLSNEEVRKLISEERWDILYESDQLNLSMLAGETFRYYNEGTIKFPPTYKFDNGTDQYDTSEKQRIPAWTDRILYRGQGLKLLDYHSANLKMSDHRPVYATFMVQCRIVEDTKREQLAREIYEERKTMIGEVVGGDVGKYIDLSGKRRDPFNMSLTLVPPPSSDKRKWWLDNDASSRVEIPKPPGEGWQLNPSRPKNPFVPTTEPDWIKVTTPQIPVSSTTSEEKAPRAPPPRRQQSERVPASPPRPQATRQQSSVSLDGRSKPPVPPKPSFMSARASLSSSSPTIDDDGANPRPPLPPRSQVHGDVQQAEKDADVGLLMDDDDARRIMEGWVPLQPSKEL